MNISVHAAAFRVLIHLRHFANRRASAPEYTQRLTWRRRRDTLRHLAILLSVVACLKVVDADRWGHAVYRFEAIGRHVSDRVGRGHVTIKTNIVLIVIDR